jgi:S-adenosylmethionine:diacylglycerol 3-amino-3-carboxypropyl transferase
LEQQPEGSLDVVSVSNVPDWLAQREARRLRAALVHALRPGGRAVARGVLADERSLAGDGLVRDPISDQLPARDRTALYGRIDLLWRE